MQTFLLKELISGPVGWISKLKGFAIKLDNLRSIPGTHTVEKESLHMSHVTDEYTYAQTK